MNSIAQDKRLFIKNTLTNFRQYDYEEEFSKKPNQQSSSALASDASQSSNPVPNHTVYLVGEITEAGSDPYCPKCGKKAWNNEYTTIQLKHLSIGGKLTVIKLRRRQYSCPYCHHHFQDKIPFKAAHHFITKQLQEYIENLLALHMLTITVIHKLTSVHPAIIKDIDKHRLQQKYVSVYNKANNPRSGIKYCYKVPNHPVRFLGIDEFSLHKHQKYATVIMDLETGEVLFVAYGKKKQVVYDFLEVADQVYSAELGEDFMKQVEAISSDMNSDYEEAFKEKYPCVKVVYDHFHIVKNFNEMVISQVKKDEQARLWKEGKWAEADLLKKSKYLLMANYNNLSKKGKSKVDQILANNKLLLLADIIKEQLKAAYEEDTAITMMESIYGIIELCNESENDHFLKFAKLLEKHLDGIITHAVYKISTGRVEGTNNKIKTVRRQAYGFRDDEYFFLKILDMTIGK